MISRNINNRQGSREAMDLTSEKWGVAVAVVPIHYNIIPTNMHFLQRFYSLIKLTMCASYMLVPT